MKIPSCTIVVISWRKNVEGLKNEQRQERTNRRRHILYPRIQQITDISYNKCDPSILKVYEKSFRKITVLNARRERKWTYTGRDKYLYPIMQLVIVNLYTNMNLLCYTVVEISLTKIWRERKKNKYREEQTGEGLFSIPRYNLSLSTCMERKKSEHIQARTNRRRLVLYLTIQLVIVNLYTKYELPVLYSCGDTRIWRKIWRERKKEQIQGRTNRRMLILNPNVQLAIVNLSTKYEVSISNGLRDILDKKLQYLMHGEKAKWTYTGKNKQEKAGSLSHNTTYHCQSVYIIWASCVIQLWRYFWRKIWREKKQNKYREEK